VANFVANHVAMHPLTLYPFLNEEGIGGRHGQQNGPILLFHVRTRGK
jgi:hypothetical protein